MRYVNGVPLETCNKCETEKDLIYQFGNRRDICIECDRKRWQTKLFNVFLYLSAVIIGSFAVLAPWIMMFIFEFMGW